MILLISLLIILVVFIYFYTKHKYNYWSERNIKHAPVIPIFGSHLKCALGLRNAVQMSCELYNKYPNEKVVGYFRGPTPVLIIRDPDILRHIMTIDFVLFYQRGLSRNVKKEPFLRNVFHSDDDVWKLMRQTLTPAFTISKLKAMFPLVIKCTQKLEVLARGIALKGGECDAGDLMERFSIDFICACALGIETDAINNDNSFFKKVGRKIFKRSLRNVLLCAIWEIFPMFRNMIEIIEKDLKIALTELVMKILKQRNFKPTGRNDFIDLLLELKEKGKIVGESIKDKNPDGTPTTVELEMDVHLIIAQVYMFYGAGFETSSSVTSCTLHKLSYNPDVQRKIQIQIDEVLSKYNDKLCYDSIAEMTLLDMALKESIRMFPAVGYLSRVCTSRYKIPKLGITIDPGVRIVIPVHAIHNDQRYYDNPDVFNPERFAPGETVNRHKYVFLPYGEGPRACIGARLGHMQSLAGLAAILHKFSVEPTKKSERNLRMNPRLNIVQDVLNGIPIKLNLRKK